MKKLVFLIASLLLLSSLTACAPKYIYVTEYARIENPFASDWLYDGELDGVEVDGTRYFFDPAIDEKQRADFIKYQKKLLKKLADAGEDTSELLIYVLCDVESRSLGGSRTAYLDVSLCKTRDQILYTLQAIRGEYSNYGYLFARSHKLATALGWEKNDTLPLDEQAFVKNPLLLNLTFPCFSEQYASESEIDACRALSVKLLSESDAPLMSEADFLAAIARYAEEKGIDFSPTHLLFAPGGDTCPLKIRTKYLEIELDVDYGEDMESPDEIWRYPFLDLAGMISFLEFTDKNLTEIRRQFPSTPEELIPVCVQPINKGLAAGGEVGGYFYVDGTQPRIRIDDAYTLTHEYVHYLDYRTDTNDNSWCAEVLAVYYGKDMTHLFRTNYAAHGAEWSIEALSKLIGEPYDSVQDEILFQNIFTAYTEDLRFELINRYNVRLSFGDYFVKTYGEKDFVDCMLTPSRAKELTGKDLDTVIDDWCLWLKQFQILDPEK